MKFKILVNHKDADIRTAWYETYNELTENPEQWAKDTIEHFNATLRPGEKKRVLLDVIIIEVGNAKLHDWDKTIKGMSNIYRGRVYDAMYCKKCGITGKRFGLSHRVKIDSKYKKKVFRDCDTAKNYLDKGGKL